jgi:hypothetical protein
MVRLRAHPDRDDEYGGQKIDPRTLAQVRGCVRQGGTLALWNRLEDWAAVQARHMGLDLEAYHDKVRREG